MVTCLTLVWSMNLWLELCDQVGAQCNQLFLCRLAGIVGGQGDVEDYLM